MGKKILIIKLFAIGDVLRTTPLLSAIKREHPKSHITWLVEKEAAGLVMNNPYIDRVLVFNLDSIIRLQVEKFDLVLSLDKEIKAAALAMQVNAKEKRGFGFSPAGNIYPLNKESEYVYSLGLSDELKFRQNKLTYQQQIYQMCKFKYQKDEYLLGLSRQDIDYAHDLLTKLGALNSKKLIGLNTGAGKRFINKSWTVSGYIELIKRLKNEIDANIILLGGPEEIGRNQEILANTQGLVFDTGYNNSITQFAGLINFCSLIVTGDTTALHIAVALKKYVIAIIGPTSAQEIDLYDRGEKIVAQMDCAPCYKNSCDKPINCMQKVSCDEVMSAIKQFIK